MGAPITRPGTFRERGGGGAGGQGWRYELAQSLGLPNASPSNDGRNVPQEQQADGALAARTRHSRGPPSAAPLPLTAAPPPCDHPSAQNQESKRTQGDMKSRPLPVEITFQPAALQREEMGWRRTWEAEWWWPCPCDRLAAPPKPARPPAIAIAVIRPPCSVVTWPVAAQWGSRSPLRLSIREEAAAAGAMVRGSLEFGGPERCASPGCASTHHVCSSVCLRTRLCPAGAARPADARQRAQFQAGARG